jgi:hypothetical protein
MRTNAKCFDPEVTNVNTIDSFASNSTSQAAGATV